MSHSRREERLSDQQIDKIFRLRRQGLSTADIGERFGFTKQWIEKVLARGPDRYGSCGEGLGPRSSRAESDQDPALAASPATGAVACK